MFTSKSTFSNNVDDDEVDAVAFLLTGILVLPGAHLGSRDLQDEMRKLCKCFQLLRNKRVVDLEVLQYSPARETRGPSRISKVSALAALLMLEETMKNR